MTFKIENIKNVYLVGIGGIGMSALARYFKTIGRNVAGYDKTPTPLTSKLTEEGIDIHFDDNLALVPEYIKKEKDNTLVIFTPAVPSWHVELNFFKNNGFTIMKRAEVLGHIFSQGIGAAVAGTHGKTTTSTMLAHILHNSQKQCNAFLGGIARNYNSNLLLSDKSQIVVAEADEYDRSFLRLYPTVAIVTSVDPDHLDIYGSYSEVIKSFNDFVNQIKPRGALVYKKNIAIDLNKLEKINKYSYDINNDADFSARNLRIESRGFCFDLYTPERNLEGIQLRIGGAMNVLNATAAAAAAHLLGVGYDEIIAGLESFEGVKRRFEIHLNENGRTYVDDYAHHPEELKACIKSARQIFPNRKLCGVFQPHLYSRTRDFADEFAKSLDMLDEIILLNIYPAREEPIPGITSHVIFEKMKNANKVLCSKDQLIKELKNRDIDVLLTLGAGDVDQMAADICNIIKQQA